MPDKLIGTQAVVETRLAKYVAVSLLTPDLLDTSAVSVEKERAIDGERANVEVVLAYLNPLIAKDWSNRIC